MGLVTIVAGLCGFVFVQDFPDKNKFLTEEQTAFVLSRIDKDRFNAEYDHWTMAKFWSYTLDIHLWIFALMLAAEFTTAYVRTTFRTRFKSDTNTIKVLLTLPSYHPRPRIGILRTGGTVAQFVSEHLCRHLLLWVGMVERQVHTPRATPYLPSSYDNRRTVLG